MNNSDPSWLFLAIGEATYTELDCLQSLFQGAVSPADYWSLMQPDHLRQIINNAEKRLLKICWQYITTSFNSMVRLDIYPTALQLQPSWRMMSELKQFIDGDMHIIGQDVSHYEYSYRLFVNSRQKYESCLRQVHGDQANLFIGLWTKSRLKRNEYYLKKG